MILFEITEGVGKITLNRPEVGNTLNIELAKELYYAVNMISANNNIKVLILTGKGKLFCGGGDLKFLLSKEKKVKQTLLALSFFFL